VKEIFDRLAACTGFDWDEGNAPKIWTRHAVSQGECEQLFFVEPLLIAPDPKHSGGEERWAALGRTADGRTLAIVFTLRGDLIRPISARDMNRRERALYAKAEGQAEAEAEADS
jgi:uncharacterized DUF497 family protein